MVILREFGKLRVSLKQKDIFPKKLSSSLSHALAYQPYKFKRNRIFDPCRVMFDNYGQGLLNAMNKLTLSMIPFIADSQWI